MSNLEKAYSMLKESTAKDIAWAHEIVHYYGKTAPRGSDLQWDLYNMFLFSYFVGVVDGRNSAPVR